MGRLDFFLSLCFSPLNLKHQCSYTKSNESRTLSSCHNYHLVWLWAFTTTFGIEVFKDITCTWLWWSGLTTAMCRWAVFTYVRLCCRGVAVLGRYWFGVVTHRTSLLHYIKLIKKRAGCLSMRPNQQLGWKLLSPGATTSPSLSQKYDIKITIFLMVKLKYFVPPNY